MTIYGLYGITHGGGYLLTLMSPDGASAILRHVAPGRDLTIHTAKGALPQYHAGRSGALERLVEAYGIAVLTRDEWLEKKAELGESALR